MSENLPAESQNDVTTLLKYLNLPHLLVGPAGHAISHLVGLGVGYLNAHFEAAVEDIKTDTAAKRLVRMKLAEAAGTKAANDPAIVDRAMDRWLGHGLRKQQNRESVATEALHLLATPSSDHSDQATGTSPPEVEEDWLNVFGQYAENASSAQMQQFWGRVLAGQIRKSHAVSLRTLRIMSELDHRLATLIDRYAAYILNYDAVLPPSPESKETAREMQQLHDSGLFTGGYGTSPGSLERGSGQVLWATTYGVLMIDMEDKSESGGWDAPQFFTFSKMTSAGTEIFGLASKPFDLSAVNQMAASLPKKGVKQIAWKAFATDLPDIPKDELLLWRQEGQ